MGMNSAKGLPVWPLIGKQGRGHELTRSRHCKCGIFSPCSFILLVMVGHDRKTLRKTAITRINYLTRLTTSSFLFENPRIISLFFLTRQLFHSYLIHIIQIYLNNSSSKQEDVKIQLSVKIIYYLYFLFAFKECE